jgi:23S rRNA (uracil1939-C5)-methyltransferase
MKLTLEKPVYGGDCLARVEGKTVFVPLTLPGETVLAHLTEEKRSFAKAELDEVLAPSPNRIVPQCSHFGVCGGCQLQHANYPAQLAMKREVLRETLSRAGVVIPGKIDVLASDAWGYRNRIRLANDGARSFGYRARRSHSIVPIRECPIAPPRFLVVAEQVAAFLATNPSPTRVTELELFTNQDESQLLLTLFCESPPAAGPEPWLAALQGALSTKVTGVRLQASDGALDPAILASTGDPSLTYIVGGFAYRVDHGAFFQVNRWLIDHLAALVTGGTSGGLAWDLFAGVGLFARRLADSYSTVLAAELAPASFPALERNLEGTCGRAFESSTLNFLRRNREEREPRPDLIVLDPPRAGLGEETTSLLNAIQAPEMIYVSCDPATLARDLRSLTLERYRVESITIVDMFPQTFHIETVARLRRG